MATQRARRETSFEDAMREGTQSTVRPPSRCSVEMREPSTARSAEEEHSPTFKDMYDDAGSLALLFTLYVLQGVPMGLAAAVPMLLKDKGASLSDIGTFSVTSLPYSLKLFWAPIIDAVFWQAMGRRKSWLIPTQLGIGLLMIFCPIGQMVEELDVGGLTLVFMLLYFLCATQDVAVDGWALTMLSKKNVALAGTCNTSGQSLGFFISLVGFLALESHNLVTLGDYCRYSGIAFIACTLIAWFVKVEKPDYDVDSIAETYSAMWRMVHLPSVRSLCILFLLWKIPFSTCSVAGLKLQDSGVPKEHLAYMTTLSLPISVFIPVLVSKWTSGGQPLSIVNYQYIPRILNGLPAVLLVATASAHHGLDTTGYVSLFAVSVVETTLMTVMFTSQMSFCARIADSAVGGTYMTVLNTVGNLGGLWVNTLVLKTCDSMAIPSLDLSGFAVQTAVCSAVGLFWYITTGRAIISNLQSIPKEDWLISRVSQSQAA